jgi:hypothetical protein
LDCAIIYKFYLFSIQQEKKLLTVLSERMMRTFGLQRDEGEGKERDKNCTKSNYVKCWVRHVAYY